MRISRHFTIGFLSLSAVLTSQTFAQSAGQCDGKTGFSLQLCQAQATGNATGVSGLTKLDPKASAFTTSYADAIRLDTWSPFEPLDPRPLMSLGRADDGSFILKPGIYDAFVQSYTLDANDSSAPRAGGYRTAIPACASRVQQTAPAHRRDTANSRLRATSATPAHGGIRPCKTLKRVPLSSPSY